MGMEERAREPSVVDLEENAVGGDVPFAAVGEGLGEEGESRRARN
jgi:hypothetical protein